MLIDRMSVTCFPKIKLLNILKLRFYGLQCHWYCFLIHIIPILHSLSVYPLTLPSIPRPFPIKFPPSNQLYGSVHPLWCIWIFVDTFLWSLHSIYEWYHLYLFLSDWFHLAQYPLVLSILLQMELLCSFLELYNIAFCIYSTASWSTSLLLDI